NTTVSFDGNTLQNVNCDVSSFEGFHHLTINNSSAGIYLNNNASIFGNIHFVDGLIDATANRVDFQPGSSHSGSGSASYINGTASKTGFTADMEFIFPVGKFDPVNSIDVFQPAGLIATTTSSTATFAVDYQHESYFPGAME